MTLEQAHEGVAYETRSNVPRQYQWPLRRSSITFFDRAKLAYMVWTSDQFTQGPIVAKYERAMAAYTGCKYAVFTSSGSTANTILAMFIRDTAPATRNQVLLPAVTWQTSCSPWIRLGFTPVFLDISRTDFSMHLEDLDRYLRVHHESVACVFVTSLLGFTPDVEELQRLQLRYNVPIMMDNCESAMSRFCGQNISSFFPSTISTYFSHHFQSIEGGFVLTNDRDLYRYAVLARNHGMARSVKTATFDSGEVTANPEVDPDFDFQMLGMNFRGTEINAAFGLCDLAKADDAMEHRLQMHSTFTAMLGDHYLKIPPRRLCLDVPFSIPIVRHNDHHNKRQEMVQVCRNLGVETRPIVSGCLTKQTAYAGVRQFGLLSNAMAINNGIYIGLSKGVPHGLMEELSAALNDI